MYGENEPHPGPGPSVPKPLFSKRHYEYMAHHAAKVNSIMFTNHLVEAFQEQPNFDEQKFRNFVALWIVRRLVAKGAGK